MKSILFILLLSIAGTLTAQEDISAIRKVFSSAQHSSETAEVLYNKLNQQKNLSPVMTGYKGASAALMAKHAGNPMNKVKYLKLSQEILETAIKMDPNHFEIRMLRFAIEVKTPGMFLKEDHIEEDSRILVQNLLDPAWPVNDFHTKIAAKLIKYEAVDNTTANKLRSKYNVNETSSNE